VTAHPDYQRICRVMGRWSALAGAWSGDVFRFAAPRWATVSHLLTGAGSLTTGGRWHCIGAFAAVYASLDPETALAESLAHYRRYGFADRDAMPRTLNAVSARLHRVLRLTDGTVRQRLGVSWDRILAEP
jgi:RES domain-containing protein